jgi:hypothetical protein
MTNSLTPRTLPPKQEITRKLYTELEIARSVGISSDTLRAYRKGYRLPTGKTRLYEHFHFVYIGKSVRFIHENTESWFTEPKDVHQKRIDDYFASLTTTPVEGVRPVGRPRKKEVSSSD